MNIDNYKATALPCCRHWTLSPVESFLYTDKWFLCAILGHYCNLQSCEDGKCQQNLSYMQVNFKGVASCFVYRFVCCFACLHH